MKYHIIFAAGFFLTIIPFIGVPTSWKLTSVAIIGAGLMAAALVRYYIAYSSQEYGQTHTDGGPEDSNTNDAAIPEESREEYQDISTQNIEAVQEKKVAQPSPYYSPKDTPVRSPRVRRTKKVVIQDGEDSDDQDDEEDASYATKNKYEEEHSF
jgi:hypothetical protein